MREDVIKGLLAAAIDARVGEGVEGSTGQARLEDALRRARHDEYLTALDRLRDDRLRAEASAAGCDQQGGAWASCYRAAAERRQREEALLVAAAKRAANSG